MTNGKKISSAFIIFTFFSLGFTYIQQIETEEDIRAREILLEVSRRFSSVHSYRCMLSTICRRDNREERRLYNYSFQVGKLIRMEISAGKDRGATLVYRDGVVRARRSGLLSFITLTFKPSDRTVTTIRGGRVDQTDFGFIIGLMQDPSKKVFWKNKDIFLDQQADVLELLETKAVSVGEPAKGLFWIADDSKLIIKYELYDKENNLLFQQIHKDIQLNVDFPKDYFKL
jgi:outer membrane lipoprotein-sorting protein